MAPHSGDSLCTSLSLGLVFVSLGACRILLIKFSANEDGLYEYLPVTVNVCAEFIKLLVCSALAFQVICQRSRPWREEFCLSSSDILDLLKWAVPGFLYFVDNLLAFYVIKYLQPALVVLLGNAVIITTSILYRIVLKRRLAKIQWASLLILFLAIISLSNQSKGNISYDHHKHHAVNHIVVNDSNIGLSHTDSNLCHPEDTQFQVRNSSDLGSEFLASFQRLPVHRRTFNQFGFHEGHILILVQCFISSSANIYNEKIFKENGGDKVSIYIQNSKLYLFGVLFNILSLIVHDVYRHKVLACGLFFGHNPYSVVLILVTALYGLNVAFILKFRDNMFHLLSSQMITVLVISASIYFFEFRPELDFFLSAPIVLMAIYIFHTSRNKGAKSVNVMHGQRLRRIREIADIDEDDNLVISRDNPHE